MHNLAPQPAGYENIPFIQTNCMQLNIARCTYLPLKKSEKIFFQFVRIFFEHASFISSLS